ncbi:PEPxxWA-CTERM sorting domain-containing protein [Microvirga sp. SRT01]|uniref:PEPxxWA-CTERM sorting domain-containing protein n=1 Tax=Sphingomonas longa TaxID=2778730 RepID=A0ABS2D5Z2_9SPHN|nr:MULTISPECIES: PEPxxWA-CTERM sorting domain-containing protein [Alphaproteobacteria]MBM6576330.1 PEPxxWA-CTERM sorting domain-containing protein [Sphingomonas sp. BT552]MBR7709376.1 PEPxxWA-CTERM sorting domain-containing protein [Microvirga sp. SRT01]
MAAAAVIVAAVPAGAATLTFDAGTFALDGAAGTEVYRSGDFLFTTFNILSQSASLPTVANGIVELGAFQALYVTRADGRTLAPTSVTAQADARFYVVGLNSLNGANDNIGQIDTGPDFATLTDFDINPDLRIVRVSFGTFNSVPARIDAVSFGAGGVPEPASWAMMIAGVALAGASLRRSRRTLAPAL